MAKQQAIQVRLDEDDAARLTELVAASEHETTSAYLRALIRREADGPGPSIDAPAATGARARVAAAGRCQRESRHRPGVRCGYCGVTP